MLCTTMNMLISLWLFWFDYQLVKQFQLARYATRLVVPCSMSCFGRPDEGCNVTCDFTLRDVFVETWCSSLLGEFRYLSEKWMCSTDVFAGLKGIKKPPSKERRKQQMPKTQVTYANFVTELLSKNWIFLACLHLVTFCRFVQSGSDRNL